MVRTVYREAPTEEEEGLDLLDHYLGIDRKTVCFAVVLVATACVIAVGLYVAFYGFQAWRQNMDRAGDMMVIRFEPPVANNGWQPVLAPQPAAAPQLFCPQCGLRGLGAPGAGGGRTCPTCGAAMVETHNATLRGGP